MALPWVPSLATLTRLVVLATRSRTKMSGALLVSPGTKLEANDSKATTEASALMEGFWLELEPWPPSFLTLTLVVLPGAADAGSTAATKANTRIDAATAPRRPLLSPCFTALSSI
jgi:hypothetical protein